MRSVKVIQYQDKEGKIGGYFAATTDIINYKDAPGFLFDENGNRIATDSFFDSKESFNLTFPSVYNNSPSGKYLVLLHDQVIYSKMKIK